ncbi:hypothetical protein Q6279_28010, partial [Klebsiella variicola]
GFQFDGDNILQAGCGLKKVAQFATRCGACIQYALPCSCVQKPGRQLSGFILYAEPALIDTGTTADIYGVLKHQCGITEMALLSGYLC